MSHLELALRDLEIVTAALAEVSLEDIRAARSILKRRSKSVARLNELREAQRALPESEREQILARVKSAAAAGDLAFQRLTHARLGILAEWSRWNQVHQDLVAGTRPGAKTVDYCG